MAELTLETVMLVQKYIQDRDYDNLFSTMETVASIRLRHCYCSCHNSVISYAGAIISLVYDLIFSDPDFFDNDKMRTMLDELMTSASDVFLSFYTYYRDSSSYLTLRYTEMLLNKDKNASKALNIIVRQLGSGSDDCFFYDMLNISTDEKFLEDITDILEDNTLSIGNNVYSSNSFSQWIWMYLTAVIEKNRFDLLDRAVEVIYKSDYNNFLSKVYYSNDEFSFTKFVRLLIERYAPEISPEQIGELFVTNNYADRIVGAYYLDISDNKMDYEEMMKKLANEIFEIGVKFKNINVLLNFGVVLNKNIDESIIQKMFDEDTVLYIGINSYFMSKNFDWMLQYVRNHPECVISIDNFNRNNINSCYNGLCVNKSQFKRLLNDRKLVLTDKVSENNCLNALVKNNAKILPLVIEAIEPDEQMCADLIDLCTKYNNINALNTVNNIYKKFERKNDDENIDL